MPLAEDKYNNAFTHALNLLAQYIPMVAVGAETYALPDTALEQDRFSFMKEAMEIIKGKASLHTSAGIASNAFVARVASQVTKYGKCLIVPDWKERRLLQNLPVDLLPASPESLRRLKFFSIYELQELANLPIGAVELQFG